MRLIILGRLTLALVGWSAVAAGATAGPALSLTQMPLEDLMRLEVSTVSRKVEPWWSAPGAVDIVTDDEIRRSGVLNIPDALRLVTGVHVGQTQARTWSVAIRGFNVTASNKLNVQIDGRSLFTPFFSGVLWDAQDTLMEDISRIEVMRGPGGALWGAYAVNGFIQILTKPSWETQGLLATAGGGTELPGFVAARYGGRLSDTTFYRAYLKYTRMKWTHQPGGGPRAQPDTDFAQAGFRSDTRSAGDSLLTLQGDIYTNKGTPEDHPQAEISGGNITGHWSRVLAVDSDVRTTAYYEYTSKRFLDPFYERRHTVSGSAKYRRVLGAHDIQLGVEGLFSRDRIEGGAIVLEPAERDYSSASVFGQDTIALVPRRLALTLGAQALYTQYAGFDVQPTVRLAWTPSEQTTLWTAVSRAVRPPVRLDVDLVARSGGVLLFEGNEELKSETALSLELGARHKFGERLAVTAAGFVNDYDNIRSYESRTTTFRAFPWTFKNTTNVRSAGYEVMVLSQPMARLFLKLGYRHLDFDLTRDPGSGDFQNGFFEANDPRHVVVGTARIDLPGGIELDITGRHASSLPNPSTPAFTTFDARLGWNPHREWELALIGRNLADRRHLEFASANQPNQEIARSVTFKATWRF